MWYFSKLTGIGRIANKNATSLRGTFSVMEQHFALNAATVYFNMLSSANKGIELINPK